MKKIELIYMDAKSSKFWNIECHGTDHTVTFGRIGTSGQTSTKSFPDAKAADAAFEKLVREKRTKGYVDAAPAVQGKGGQPADGEGGGATGGSPLPSIAFHAINKTDELQENTKTFIGRKVVDFDPEKPAKDPAKFVYRFRSGYDDDVCLPRLEAFLESDASLHAVGLVIGLWSAEDPSETDPSSVIDALGSQRERLPELRALYLGDIVSEENEMSWIQQTDLSPLLEAFPNLELLRARGGEGLSLSKPKHARLRALALETGGLPAEVVRAIGASDFPELEHLELWIGTEQYGGTSTVEDYQTVLSGKLFPKLKYLGLRNCDFADDLASVVVNSPLINRIETLDLSLGTLSDEGAKALLSIPASSSLQRISVFHHFTSAEVTKKLKSFRILVDTSERGEDDEEDRFVAVGE